MFQVPVVGSFDKLDDDMTITFLLQQIAITNRYQSPVK
jgi:hypothetical protein